VEMFIYIGTSPPQKKCGFTITIKHDIIIKQLETIRETIYHFNKQT
jgi:hypothetical protein